MPNWCNNTIELSGPVEKIKGLFDKIEKLGENKGLLELMVPIGEWDYSTAIETWGTKWDVSTGGLEFTDNGDGTAEISGYFDSAWSPPITAYDRFIEENEDCDIEAFYYEMGMGFGGIYRDGEDQEISDLQEHYEQGEEFWSDTFIELNDHFNISEDFDSWIDEEMDDDNEL